MNSSVGLLNFVRNNASWWVLFGSIVFLTIVSFMTLTTKPRLWTDEAVTIEIAHSLSRFGELNIQTSPTQFFEFPYLLQSTGYPLTVLLAAVFRIFGFSFVAVRSFMVFVMLASYLPFSFGRNVFGPKKTALLFTSYARSFFYASGRTATGEVGSIFLDYGASALFI